MPRRRLIVVRLGHRLLAACDDLRGNMDASEYTGKVRAPVPSAMAAHA